MYAYATIASSCARLQRPPLPEAMTQAWATRQVGNKKIKGGRTVFFAILYVCLYSRQRASL